MPMPLLFLILQVLILLGMAGNLGLAATIGSLVLLAALYVKVNRRGPSGDYIQPEGEEFSWLQEELEKLSKRAGIKTPKLLILDEYIPNAFSYGRTVVLSMGLFEVLEEEEIIAVMAHEIGHIKNRDTLMFPLVVYGRYFSIGAVMLTFMLSNKLALGLLSLIFYAFYEESRAKFMKNREFKADETALHLLDVPMSMKRALEELKYYEDLRSEVKMTGFPGIDPSIERPQKNTQLIETHPSYDERIIRIILEMENLKVQRGMLR
ncbi:M48 family metallopeptidase [Thermococcus sp.]|uniref:M48 family metallopeptidase n=1 Tax=Thermococcus sp. TaxID=35749 RepID=UPI00260BB9E1|nr:M48 family metalloprotease [Thermococcus sp.]